MTDAWNRPRHGQAAKPSDEMSMKREASRPRVSAVPSRTEHGGCKNPNRGGRGYPAYWELILRGARGRDFRDESQVRSGRVSCDGRSTSSGMCLGKVW